MAVLDTTRVYQAVSPHENGLETRLSGTIPYYVVSDVDNQVSRHVCIGTKTRVKYSQTFGCLANTHTHKIINPHIHIHTRSMSIM